ncbi:MAG: ester cyclase [Anaerolineae bacterium]|nr:ester cyclase [Anaerolineae bacterium]
MSSSVVDIVKAYFGTYSLMTADKAALFLSDDFQLIGFGDNPIGKDLWVRLMNALKTAMPDLKFKISDIRTNGNVVSLTQFGVGTHNGPMDLTAINHAVYPATGKTVTFPSAEWAFTVENGKIVKEALVSSSSPETGLAGILKVIA